MAAAVASTDGASSINVTVRVRPFTIQEAAQLSRSEDNPLFLGDGSLAAAPTTKVQKGIRSVIKVVDDRCLIFDPPHDTPVQRYGSTAVGKKVKDTTFAFDRVFDENASQIDVYEASTKNLLDAVLDGYNSTVFAYGATGCGKTHTISGTSAEPGVIFMTMQDLFERLEELKDSKTTEVTLSYLEIYNETIRDLLNPSDPAGKAGLHLREDSQQAVSVAGLTSHRPQSVDEVMDIVIQGNAARTQSPTEANATSSRSHAVLQVNVSLKDRDAGVSEPVTFATLSIIDLAGSERASATKNRGARLQEGANINKSLLALGSCINALCENRKSVHVPYRNSKLTRLLKFSLGGNCRTVMIVCISPSSLHYDETQNTLRYANRAKNIQTKSIRNVFSVNRHVKDYVKKIDEQGKMILELKEQVAAGETVAMDKVQKTQAKLDKVLKEGLVRLRAAFDNSSTDRKERLNLTLRRQILLSRITFLTAWLGAFDAACDEREDDEPVPVLIDMRQTAVAILSELETSRSHFALKLQGHNWARALDTAFQDCLRQLQDSSFFQAGCAAEVSLRKEVDVLKMRADVELSAAVLEHVKGNEANILQVVLQAQFEAMAIIQQLSELSPENLVESGNAIMAELMHACTEAVGHVIKPDGKLQITQPAPPTKSGTPRKPKYLLVPSPVKPRTRNSMSTQSQLSALPAHMSAVMAPSSPRMGSSPNRSANTSPKRRVRPGGLARKGVQFSAVGSPKKKLNQKKRAVRWRDENVEDGTQPGELVEYLATPKAKTDPVPAVGDDNSSKAELPAVSSETTSDEALDSSPLPVAPVASSEPRSAGNGRFANGFLSKSKTDSVESPAMPPPSLTLGCSSSADESSPLREIGANSASRPSIQTITNQLPGSTVESSDTSDRENVPETSSSTTSSDAEGPFDKEIMNEMRHSLARKKRSSSMGSNTASRIRERAARRRSPTASSFIASSPSSDTNVFPTHARRPPLGREEPVRPSFLLSPRVTAVGREPVVVRGQVRQRQSMVDLSNTTPRETPIGAKPRLHLRSSSFVPGSDVPGSAIRSAKGPWR